MGVLFELFQYLAGCPLPKNTKLHGEQQLCIHMANFLRECQLTGRMNAGFIHIANEHKTSRQNGAVLKAMGKLAGAPDYLFFKDGKALFVEVKVDGKTYGTQKTNQKPPQKKFQRYCEITGMKYFLIRSTGELEDILKHEGYIDA